MIPEIGQFALILALTVACCSLCCRRSGPHAEFRSSSLVAKPAAQAQFLFVLIAFVCLGYSFINNDFSVLNVATNSNSQTATSLSSGGNLGIARRVASALDVHADVVDDGRDAVQQAPAAGDRCARTLDHGDDQRWVSCFSCC